FPAYTSHVNDFANVLDAGTKQQLETILLNFEKRSGAQIAVVTVPSLNERPVEDYANELYRAWGIGAKSGEHKDKGALLVIAPNDKKSRLEVGYGLEGDLPDGLAGEMLRRMRPYFQQKQWSQGITVGVRTLVDTLAQKWNISVEGIDRQYAYAPQPDADVSGGQVVGGVICIFIAVIIFILLMIMLARRGGGGGGRRSSGWHAAPMIWNSGGGGFGSGSVGGGSWGGGDSGGGGGSDWGGFGGGSSGGGGASDSW
ncbi:MAG: TPM domain-containing protein, partial [Acidobacteria bacterium]|nr:TPM domain-containing protein [Acidobacteriota bacterium]